MVNTHCHLRLDGWGKRHDWELFLLLSDTPYKTRDPNLRAVFSGLAHLSGCRTVPFNDLKYETPFMSQRLPPVLLLRTNPDMQYKYLLIPRKLFPESIFTTLLFGKLRYRILSCVSLCCAVKLWKKTVWKKKFLYIFRINWRRTEM